MTTRIGDFAQSNRISALLLETQTRSRVTQTQVGTGKIADRFMGLGANVEQLVNVKAMLSKSYQYQESNGLAVQKQHQMESSVSAVFDIANRAQALIIQRQNDGVVEPGTMNPEIRALLDQVVTTLNAKMDGHYLFGGSVTDRPPVELDPAFLPTGVPDDTYYQGDALELSLRAADDLDVTYGMSADRDGFRELIGGIRAFIDGDVTDDPDLLEAAHDLIRGSLTKIADYQAELGIRHARLEQIDLQHADVAVYMELRMSEIENIDVSEAISRLAQDQVLLESTMAVVAKLHQLTLADYL
jgi:flagellar hook-associated protein 3 FlgL